MTLNYPRTLLFVPGHREAMVAKAADRRADAIVFDLEDSVPIAEKETARQVVTNALANWSAPQAMRLYVRINPPRMDMLDDDIDVLRACPEAGIVVPKVDLPVELAGVFDRVGRSGRDVIVNIETPRSLFHLQEFADAHGVGGLFLGGEDLTEALGMHRTAESHELAQARFMLLAACRGACIAAYDTICPEFRDLSILEADARTASAMGFDGKFAIHPAQIEPVAKAFTPGNAEVEQARKIVDAYDRAVAEGRGAVAVDGKMIDPPVAERARALVQRAERN